MGEVITIASLSAREGFEEEVERRLRGYIAPTHAESGCLLYALHRQAGTPGGWVLIEHWESREALEAHREAAHMADLRTEFFDLLAAPPTVQFLKAVPEGDPAKGALP